MVRNYREHQFRREVAARLEQLEQELERGTHRRHLEALVRLIALILPECGGSILAQAYKTQHAHLKVLVEERTAKPRPKAPAAHALIPTRHPHLRIVK